MHTVLECVNCITENMDAFSLIDVGCAEGWLFDVVNQSKNVSYVGVDISSSNIKKAKNKEGNWVLCTAENLPFKSNSFEILVCTEVLEHVLGPALCMVEISRIVKHYAILTTPVIGSPYVLDVLKYNDMALKNNKRIRTFFETIGIEKTLKSYGPHINCFTLSNLRKIYPDRLRELLWSGISFDFPLLKIFLKIFPPAIELHMVAQKYAFKYLPLFTIGLPMGNKFSLILLEKKYRN